MPFNIIDDYFNESHLCFLFVLFPKSFNIGIGRTIGRPQQPNIFVNRDYLKKFI